MWTAPRRGGRRLISVPADLRTRPTPGKVRGIRHGARRPERSEALLVAEIRNTWKEWWAAPSPPGGGALTGASPGDTRPHRRDSQTLRSGHLSPRRVHHDLSLRLTLPMKAALAPWRLGPASTATTGSTPTAGARSAYAGARGGTPHGPRRVQPEPLRARLLARSLLWGLHRATAHLGKADAARIAVRVAEGGSSRPRPAASDRRQEPARWPATGWDVVLQELREAEGSYGHACEPAPPRTYSSIWSARWGEPHHSEERKRSTPARGALPWSG